MSNKKAFHIILVGRVQGVGLRYFAQQKALDYNLKGWVKNKTDGSVEIEIEGDLGMIDVFIENLKIGNSYSRVDRIFKSELPDLRYYDSFFVKY